MTKVYFKNLKNEVIKELNKAEESIKIAMAWIDLSAYEKILAEKSLKGIKIEILLDENDSNQKQKVLIDSLIIKKVSINFVKKHNTINTMHHKFCIIDDRVILAGSFNWTNNAFYNFENLIVIENDEIISKMFLSEFYEILLYSNYMDLVKKHSSITRLLYEEHDTSRGGTEENNIYIYEIDNKGEHSISLYDTTGTMLTSDDTDFGDIYKQEVEAESQEELDQIKIYKEICALDRMLDLQSIALEYSRRNKKIIDGIIVKTIDDNCDTIYKTIWKNRFSKTIEDKYYF